LFYNCQYFSIDYIPINVILDIEAAKEYIKWVHSKEGLIYKGSFFLCSTSGLRRAEGTAKEKGVYVQNVVMHAPTHDIAEGKPKHLPGTHLVKASEGSKPRVLCVL